MFAQLQPAGLFSGPQTGHTHACLRAFFPGPSLCLEYSSPQYPHDCLPPFLPVFTSSASYHIAHLLKISVSHPSLHTPLPCLMFPSKHLAPSNMLSNFLIMFISLFMRLEDLSALFSTYLTHLSQCLAHSKVSTRISGMNELLRTITEKVFKRPLVTVASETMICSSLQSKQPCIAMCLFKTTSSITPHLKHLLT